MRGRAERIKRIVATRGEKSGAILYLENLNKEPRAAEVHYLAHTLEEWRYYFDAIDSPSLRLSFTANHAHLVPEGVEGFIDALDFRRVGEVRLADCFRNGHEVHLFPATAISTSAACSSASRPRIHRATTPTRSDRSTTCWRHARPRSRSRGAAGVSVG